MKLIDTHSHLYLEAFDADRPELVRLARESGIEALLLPNVDLSTISRMHALCDRYPGFAYPMMGLHPTSVDRHYAGALRMTELFLGRRKYCAIGEIGIDLYWDKSYLKEQKIVFEEQLRWSIALDLPVAIHTREAFPEVLDSLHKIGAEKLKGVFHSFSGGEEELRDVLKLPHFKIGVSGVVTFKRAKLAEILPLAGIGDIVLETDAPYLSPAPYRGKRNEPVYIWKTAEKIAEIYHLTIEETVGITRENAVALFEMAGERV
ncbi:MAG: TatD family hydrolase [Tannerellaceae bacterium]|jgi:TatD DNase family protein|nr:TatD family hydrolase [Tannerellaceae bacterium]